ncbi:putative DNA binding protein [Methanocella conradii HZ254]|uniref:DNA binding protein n=1 Tax=Methanocella conradii (strain DSM 24694 / JCM 17849 / CGMCC 1.5162 / HZ254) TaxID=1041930 RepID=H8I5K6_METCZ|nr:helix-turn-helix domain-containing protein [Methanocella conradii]AFC99325.1 putative DNA binding protein [Methanocella conradii HZ254]
MSIAMSIGIRHRDCWHYRLSKALAATIIVKYTYMLPNDQLYGYQTIVSARIGELESFLASIPQVKKFAILSRSADRAEVITWAEQSSIIDSIIKKNCVFIGPTIVKDGVENWHIVAPTREELQEAVAALERCAEIAYIRSAEVVEPDVGLTERQMSALKAAVEMGYFETPRRSSIKDVAKRLKVSPSTAVEHLRKAEKKVLESYAKP